MIYLISYKPLWETLEKKEISQYALIHKYHISSGQLSRIRKGKHISTHTINMFCEILNCKIEEIVVYEKE